MRVIYCKNCGKPFEHKGCGRREFCTTDKGRGYDPTTCSRQYQNRVMNEKNRKEKKPIVLKICPKCGNRFIPKPRQKYCSRECYRYVHNRHKKTKEGMKRDYYRNKKKGVYEKRRKKNKEMRDMLRAQRLCIFCASELEVDDLARCKKCKKRDRENYRKKCLKNVVRKNCVVCGNNIKNKMPKLYCGVKCKIKARGKSERFKKYLKGWGKKNIERVNEKRRLRYWANKDEINARRFRLRAEARRIEGKRPQDIDSGRSG